MKYDICVPYKCIIVASIETEKEIKNDEDAFDEFMNFIDNKRITFALLDRFGEEVNRFSISVEDGKFCKRIENFSTIDWTKSDSQ